MARVDQARVTLTVEGRAIPITFSKREGGKKGSEEEKYRPGGEMPEKAQGGAKTIENVTLKGEYLPEIHQGSIDFMESARGDGRAVVTEQATRRGVAVGKPKVWTGILMSVDTGEYDANSGDTREVEVEISTDGD